MQQGYRPEANKKPTSQHLLTEVAPELGTGKGFFYLHFIVSLKDHQEIAILFCIFLMFGLESKHQRLFKALQHERVGLRQSVECSSSMWVGLQFGHSNHWAPPHEAGSHSPTPTGHGENGCLAQSSLRSVPSPRWQQLVSGCSRWQLLVVNCGRSPVYINLGVLIGTVVSWMTVPGLIYQSTIHAHYIYRWYLPWTEQVSNWTQGQTSHDYLSQVHRHTWIQFNMLNSGLLFWAFGILKTSGQIHVSLTV